MIRDAGDNTYKIYHTAILDKTGKSNSYINQKNQHKRTWRQRLCPKTTKPFSMRNTSKCTILSIICCGLQLHFCILSILLPPKNSTTSLSLPPPTNCNCNFVDEKCKHNLQYPFATHKQTVSLLPGWQQRGTPTTFHSPSLTQLRWHMISIVVWL